jgi:antitoxin VapB
VVAPYVPDTHQGGDGVEEAAMGETRGRQGPSTRCSRWSILQVYINEEAAMETAKLFMNGRSQAVRLPKGFRFEGEEVFIKKVGNAVVLLPRQRSWETLYESLGSFSEDFMEERGQPVAGQERAEAPFD